MGRATLGRAAALAAAASLMTLSACWIKTGGTLQVSDDVSAPDADASDLDAEVIPDVDDPDPAGDIPLNCGNGVVDEGEECDDANSITGDGCEYDCTFSCHGDEDCLNGSVCDGVESCSPETHACLPGTPRENGFVCSTSPRWICLFGSCQPSVCGDGFVDPGSDEFCEPSDSDPSCGEDCTYACLEDEDCADDGNECNGEEYCTDAHRCGRRDALADGTLCESEGEERTICLGSTCQVSVCGDGFVDSGTDPAEDCEDLNDVNGDGCDNDCSYSCREDDDCDDENPCNGQETCDTAATHSCLPGTNASSSTPCDDDNPCTERDHCDGSGLCVGTGGLCDDGLSCTTDTCDEITGSCTNTLMAGFCRISSVCYNSGALNPAQECQACIPTESTSNWSSRPDMTACRDGVCCSGQCRAGGQCCDDVHCTPGCAGTARPCSSFSNDPACVRQSGCTVTSASGTCMGTLDCTTITGVSVSTCTSCGCPLSDCTPLGLCTCAGASSLGCADLANYSSCLRCGCGISGTFSCSGTHAACSTYTEGLCPTQLDCEWSTGECQSYRCQ